MISGSFASPEAIAHIMVQKYAMASPLYRQEQELDRTGIQLTRQTMSNWTIRAADDWLTPVYEELHCLLVQEKGRHIAASCFLWNGNCRNCHRKNGIRSV